MTRRNLLALLGSASVAQGQDMSSRNVRPTPRSKPSGVPWRSRLVDVAQQAGLRHPSIYGGVDRKEYILQVDLDNDGLPDLFVVTGSVYPELERKLPQYPYASPRLVFRNLGRDVSRN